MAALNITLHTPHPAAQYVRLFDLAFRQRAVIGLGTLHGIMIGSLSNARTEKPDFLAGEFYRFVKLNPDEPWFNAESKEPATQEEIEEIKIPKNLVPHLRRIPFVFNVKRHELWYISKDQNNILGVKNAEKFLGILLDRVSKKHQMPEVEVTAIPDRASVTKILKLPGLEYLEIDLVRPNPDTGQTAEQRWLKRLEEQKSKRMKLLITRSRGEILEPDAETREMAEVAARNGSVYGRGRGADGLTIEDSTKRRPMLVHEHVDTDTETHIDVLQRQAL